VIQDQSGNRSQPVMRRSKYLDILQISAGLWYFGPLISVFVPHEAAS
jgi:hypothetical protein